MIDFHGLSNVVNAVSEKDRTKVAMFGLVIGLTGYVVDKVDSFQRTKLAIENGMEPTALLDNSKQHLLSKSAA